MSSVRVLVLTLIELLVLTGCGGPHGLPLPAGIITEFAIPTPRSDPGGIAAGPDGNLWFTKVNVSKFGRITSGR